MSRVSIDYPEADVAEVTIAASSSTYLFQWLIGAVAIAALWLLGSTVGNWAVHPDLPVVIGMAVAFPAVWVFLTRPADEHMTVTPATLLLDTPQGLFEIERRTTSPQLRVSSQPRRRSWQLARPARLVVGPNDGGVWFGAGLNDAEAKEVVDAVWRVPEGAGGAHPSRHGRLGRIAVGVLGLCLAIAAMGWLPYPESRAADASIWYPLRVTLESFGFLIMYSGLRLRQRRYLGN